MRLNLEIKIDVFIKSSCLQPDTKIRTKDIKTTKNGHQYREIIDTTSGTVVGKYYIKERILQLDTKKTKLAERQPINQMY